VWWVWIDAHFRGLAPRFARLFRDAEVGYQPEFQWFAFAVGTFLTVLWLALVRPARRSNRRAVLNWAAGMTLVWGLYMTIWLPYIDLRRSYRPVAEALVARLPTQGCVASRELGEPLRALLYYYAGLATVREEHRPDHDCAYLLVQHGRLETSAAAPAGWIAVHEGRRRGDESERYVLYRRMTP
jgi:4-amino-4-deoxy-L-arabinose transferase-like glycosyltransferase